MKSTLLVMSSFLLFAFVFTMPSIATDELARTEPVLDIDGDELRAGGTYYILPVLWGTGGGITTTNKTCPLNVVQDPFQVSNGIPITFKNGYSKDDVIRASSDVNIKFHVEESCTQSPVWKIQEDANSDIQWYVTTGGVEGNPGIDTIANWFKIEKAGFMGYKLAFCPKVCRCTDSCRDIGLHFKNGERVLALTDEPNPFTVAFKKASDSSTSL